MLDFLTIVFGIPSMILKGFVITFLWKWFIVPLGVTEVGLVHAIGIGCIITFLTYSITNIKWDKNDSDKIKEIIAMYFVPLIFWGLGYVINLFM